VSAANPLVEQIRSGQNEELLVLAAQGILPVPPEELIPLQIELATSGNPTFADFARDSLLSLETGVALAYLGAEPRAQDLRWFGLEHTDPQIVETVLKRRDVPQDLLVALAPRLSADLQEVLLLRQDLIVENPGILEALEGNPQISVYSQRRIAEYRQHLLARDVVAEPEPVEEEAGGDRLTPEELEAIEAARQLEAQGEIDERTGLSESQIRSLAIPVKIKLSRGASRTLRSILVKDSNRLVSLAVLGNAAFTEDEIEQVTANRSIDEEVLATISRRREWVSKYAICKALVQNPRTPVGIAVRLVSRLSVRDLKLLKQDRNVPEAVRATASRLYRIKAV